MANILSNFQGWGPTEVAYEKKITAQKIELLEKSSLYI